MYISTSLCFTEVAFGWNHALLLTGSGIFNFYRLFLFQFWLFLSKEMVYLVRNQSRICLAGDGEAFMLGGNHHGALSDPDKMSSVKHLQGIISLNYFKATFLYPIL